MRTNYRHGVPHYYVCLDAGDQDEYSFWFDSNQTEALGRKLQEFGPLIRQQDADEEERLWRLPEGDWANGPPGGWVSHPAKWDS